MPNLSKMMLVLFSIGFILTVAGADSNCVARNDEAMALVNGTRVLETLRELQRFGATGEGLHGLGVSRRALTAADMEARRWLAERMKAAGLRNVRFDGIGTLIGEGGATSAPALLIGSHSDTQPMGGWLDGALGVVYAIEAARVLHAIHGLSTQAAAWTVVDWQDEEGRFGTLTASRNFAGIAAPPLEPGGPLATARAEAGLDGVPLYEYRTARPGGFLGALEAHIEQGSRLERANASLGVVSAIVGMRQLILTLSGRQDHAGGCAMPDRADATLAAMRVAVGIDEALHAAEWARRPGQEAVWTVTSLDGFVSHSTVPGAASLKIQFRAPEEDTLERIEELVIAHCERRDEVSVHGSAGHESAHNEGRTLPPLSSGRAVKCTVAPAREPTRAAPMDQALRACVRSAARAAIAAAAETSAPPLEMPSRAIHDAAPLASVMPSAMLFVPSIGGISHSFDEHTHDADIVIGAKAFAAAAHAIVQGRKCSDDGE
jgi:N-carbamoyl-L-amino-acid hydrolase